MDILKNINNFYAKNVINLVKLAYTLMTILVQAVTKTIIGIFIKLPVCAKMGFILKKILDSVSNVLTTVKLVVQKQYVQVVLF